MEGLIPIIQGGLPLAALAAAVLFILLRRRGAGKAAGGGAYDERQLVERGRAYKLAFFTLLLYNFAYACAEGLGFKWCKPPVGMLVGIFVGVTVFAVSAITRDALGGIRSDAKSTIALWVLIIAVQSACFAADCLEGRLIENKLLTLSFVSLTNAVCFLIVLVVYLVHNRKAALAEEAE